jgi:DNA invertase Pin-like site-specific DNA recombinase
LGELRQVADRHGWLVQQVYADEGISGTKGREGRPEFDKLLKAIARREVDMVAAWSVDRLGRSLRDLVSLLSDLKEAKASPRQSLSRLSVMACPLTRHVLK